MCVYVCACVYVILCVSVCKQDFASNIPQVFIR